MEIKVHKDEFIDLYESHTLGQLAEHYDVRVNQILKIAKQLGLSKKGGENSLEIEE